MSGTSPTHVAVTASVELEPGTTLGSWQVGELLGKGAMGCVYRARHVRLRREAAIKVLNAEYVARPDVVDRFFREARVVNEIDHEHIVEVTDFVEAPGIAYLVMELLEGESLRELMGRRGRKYPPIARLVAIVRQVCAALDAAHAKGIIHRDLKPDNVFVIQRGGADFAKVLDFGVARLLDHSDQASSTMSGMILGTPHYMSPEQALGQPVGRDADVWAAGVVLHELLAGAVPFAAPSFVELAVAIREKPPRPLPRKTPRGERIPPWLAAVVSRCLEKRAEDRYRTMAALAAALEGPPRRSWLRRNAVALSVALAAAAGVAAAVRLGVPRPLRDAGERAAGTARAVVSRLAETPTPPSPGVALPPERTVAEAPEHARRPAVPAAPPVPAPVPAPRSPAAERASTARGPVPAPAPAKAPRARRTVELRIRSTPPGASVTRLDTGRRLGKTPLALEVPRKAATVWLELALDGYARVKFSVDLAEDAAANVTLQRKRGSRPAAGARRGG